MAKLNRYSSRLTENIRQPAAQAMLHAIGLTKDDLHKAQVGIASTGYDGNPCNMHLNELSARIKKSVWDSGLVGLMFHTIGVSDGISMGSEGMKYLVPERRLGK